MKIPSPPVCWWSLPLSLHIPQYLTTVQPTWSHCWSQPLKTFAVPSVTPHPCYSSPGSPQHVPVQVAREDGKHISACLCMYTELWIPFNARHGVLAFSIALIARFSLTFRSVILADSIPSLQLNSSLISRCTRDLSSPMMCTIADCWLDGRVQEKRASTWNAHCATSTATAWYWYTIMKCHVCSHIDRQAKHKIDKT